MALLAYIRRISVQFVHHVIHHDRKRIMTRLILMMFVVCFSFGAASAVYADDTGIAGFNGVFFRPTVDGQGILNVDTARVLFPGAMYAGSHFQYARRTISFSDPALGGLVTDLVENQVLMNVVMGVGLFSFLDAGVDIPIALMQNGTSCLDATCTTVSNYTGYGLGDIRLVLKLKILDDKEGSVGLALASDVGFPSGKRNLFTGGKNPSYEQRLIVSKTFKHAEIAANIGYRIVDRVEQLGIIYDDSLTFGLGVRGFLPRDFFLYGTVTGNALLADASKAATPVEFMGGFGHRWKKHNIACQLGGGARLVDGVTAADYRAMGFCGIDFGLTQKARNHLNPQPVMEWMIPLNTNQYTLKRAQTEILDDVVRWLQANRERRVLIIGKADDRASYDYNMKLSTARALNARDYLLAHSVLPEQIKLATHGEAVPFVYGKSPEDRRVNRSIVVQEIRD